MILATSLQAQSYPGHRLPLGPGTILLVPDSQTGLTLWARRDTRPHFKPTPDFVGWFEPQRITAWVPQARAFLRDMESPTDKLVAPDGGWVDVQPLGDIGFSCCILVFGHPSERQVWIIESSVPEVERLLDTMLLVAGQSQWAPPPELAYANPTNRADTPDRELGPPPVLHGERGETWARMELDSTGKVIPGRAEILWASSGTMGKAVLRVLPSYKYKLRNHPIRIVVYQRFRAN